MSDYPGTEITSPCPFLLVLSGGLGSDNRSEYCTPLAWLTWDTNASIYDIGLVFKCEVAGEKCGKVKPQSYKIDACYCPCLMLGIILRWDKDWFTQSQDNVSLGYWVKLLVL